MSGQGPLDFDDERHGAARPEGPEAARPPDDVPPPADDVPPPPPPARPQGSSRYGWFLGVVAFLLIVVAIINGISSEGVPTGGPSAADEMAAFAVPYADRPPSDSDDANVATKAGQGEAGDTPACRVRGEQILNVCELWERGPVVLAVFPTKSSGCRAVLDQLERAHRAFPRVQIAAVGSKGDRDDLRGEWTFPVGWDKDGAVATRYGLVSCPQITFARRGGKVVETTRQSLSDRELGDRIRRLVR